jgi:hypothetical protein
MGVIMVRKSLTACAAIMCASGAHATPIEITRTANGSVLYFEDTSVRPLDVAGRHGAIQFWEKTDNPPTQSIRHWGIRIYLDCATLEHMTSYAAGTDDNGKLLQVNTWGAAQQTWTTQDVNGAIAFVAKRACPSR